MSEAELDVVLLGGTGFVGRMTAEHLARQAPAGVRFGLAGRSTDKLAGLRDDLGESAAGWTLVRADLTDSASIVDLARRARVVISTAGPYAPRGLPLVRACAEAGTAYADLTGETLFARRSVETCHEPAAATGARIVHSCGFDSVPSDLGVGLCAARAELDRTGPLTGATLHVRSARGGVSGGTVDSLRQQLVETAGDRDRRRLLGDPYALTGERARGGRQPGPRPLAKDPQTGRWAAPFVMGTYNRQIVLRSNALTGWSYGRDFGYTEVVDTGAGLRGAVAAAVVAGGTGGLVAAMAFGPTRRVLDVVLPDPGEGPRASTLDRGRFRVEVEATTATGARYRTRIGADLDPGYRGTAVMLGEAGLSLALDSHLPDRAGVLTPMTALGEALAARLRNRGFTVVTERDPD